MTITFTEFGAAECIDGSKGILQVLDKKYLIDCGKDYQIKPDTDVNVLPFDAKGINSILATHAHGDHIGALLDVIRAGFGGEIYSTYQTAEITKIQLLQEAGAQNFKAYNESIKGKRYTSGPKAGQYIPFKKNKYSYEDVKNAMGLFAGDIESRKGFAYGKHIDIDEHLQVTFYEAGHIPGSAQIFIDVHEHGKNLTFLTACDLGRTDYFIKGHPIANIPLVKAPDKDFHKPVDHILLEATYGAKVHKPLEESVDKLYNTIMDTARRKGGLIIPAFSIMRTHLLSIILYDFYKSGKLPEDMKFYISSPNADEVSKVIMRHPEDMDWQTAQKFKNKHDNPFWFDRLVHHKKYTETQQVLADNDKPYCIIGASGMCDMGRIVDVLKNTISDPNNTIALLGYQAEGTRGKRLLNKEQNIMFGKESVPLRADVVNISGFSGHVDCEESIAHLKYINAQYPQHRIKTINIKHGEKEQCYALAQKLQQAGFPSGIIRVLKKGQPVALD